MKYPLVDSESDRIWLKYCGFLDLSIRQFMSIQESLLREQLERLSRSPLGQKLMGMRRPLTVNEFRPQILLTQPRDYLPELESGDESCLPGKPFVWAHTSGRQDAVRRVPFTREAYKKQLDNLMTVFLLACASSRRQTSIREGDRVLFNVSPNPYLSGILAKGITKSFELVPVVELEKLDKMEFKEKLAAGFDMSLRTGIDILFGLSSVLSRAGNDFDKHYQRISSASRHVFHPGEFYRFTRGYLWGKINNRSVLPKDIWPLKAVIGWGNDTESYKEQIYSSWGAYPFQLYECTEAGIMAVQSWNRQDLTFIPQSNFYEFIPETERLKARSEAGYQPQTVLLSEIKTGERYEVVITSLYGMPFIRYRLGHLVRFSALSDEKAQIKLPQMRFESRVDLLTGTSASTYASIRSVPQATSGIDQDYLD